MNPLENDETKGTNQVPRKRAAEGSPPHSPPSRHTTADPVRRNTNTAKKAKVDEWDLLMEKIDDVLVGRADKNLDDWEAGWLATCEALDAQDRFKMDEKELLKDVGAILKRCAFLEKKLGIRD